MQLSKNLFVNFFLRFANIDQSLKILKKKDDPHSLCIFENMGYERRG